MTAEQQRLVLENRDLAHAVAYNVAGHDPDAHAVAMEGLCRAALKYDPDRAVSSWKYVAISTIKNTLHRQYWTHQYSMYIPPNVLEDKKRAYRIAEGDDAKAIDYYRNTEKGYGVYRAKSMTSMDKPIDESGHTIHDTVGTDGLQSEVVQRSVESTVRERVRRLRPKYRYVMQRRYGIELEYRSNIALAQELGLSRQRIQQIIKQASEWLRRDMRLKELAA
jgi:RNA polymerase sigma factor (sigma-70 family)